jgi:hypothetical protein
VSGGTFVDGVLFLVWAAVLSFVSLVVFYFLAEGVVVVVDIARNIRLLVQQTSGTSEKGVKNIAARERRTDGSQGDGFAHESQAVGSEVSRPRVPAVLRTAATD